MQHTKTGPTTIEVNAGEVITYEIATITATAEEVLQQLLAVDLDNARVADVKDIQRLAYAVLSRQGEDDANIQTLD